MKHWLVICGHHTVIQSKAILSSTCTPSPMTGPMYVSQIGVTMGLHKTGLLGEFDDNIPADKPLGPCGSAGSPIHNYGPSNLPDFTHFPTCFLIPNSLLVKF